MNQHRDGNEWGGAVLAFEIKSSESEGHPKGVARDGMCGTDEPGARGGSDYDTRTVGMVD